MRNLVAVAVLSILLASAGSAYAGTIVHYDGNALGVSASLAGYDYTELDDPNDTLKRVNFTENLIYTSSYNQQNVFGGVAIHNVSSVDPQFRGPGGYGPYQSRWMGRFSGKSEQGGTPGGVEAVLMWGKDYFLNDGNTAAVIELDATSMLSVTSGELIRDDNDGMGLVFVVKNGGTYYYSQSSLKGDPNTLTIDDPTAELWAEWDPTADPTDYMPTGSETFATRTFDDVQAVGLLVDSWRNQYAENVMVTDFQVDATIPEPATMALTALGGLGVLLRRRRR
jgi:hypothetical protein